MPLEHFPYTGLYTGCSCSLIYAADVISVFDAGAEESPEREGREEKTPAMRSVCTGQVGRPESAGSLPPGMYLSP